MIKWEHRLRRLEGQLSPPGHGGRPCCIIPPEQIKETEGLSKKELAARLVRDFQESEERLKRKQPEEYARLMEERARIQRMPTQELSAYVLQRIRERRPCCTKAP